MPAALIPKEEVVARLFVVFRDHGYEGASLTELSRATGLGKSSLYHYFPGGKEDMARAVLDFVDAWFAQNVFAPLQGKGAPRERLQRMLDAMDGLYGGLVSYEGRPAATLIDYTGALKRELDDIAKDFDALREKDLAAANMALKAKGQPEIALPEHAPVAWRYNGNADTRAAEQD